MNKQHYRLVFNKFRGVLMAVAEHIASSGPSAGSGTEGLASRATGRAHNTTATLKPVHFAVLCRLGMVSLVGLSAFNNLAHADIIADHAAPANQRPVILNAPNGVPLVNIQTPSAAGVSRNSYSQFDVNANGVILNNSRNNVQTQLGGFVQGNPYLATGSARVILNEVNSNNPSLLNGYVEVAGSRAQVVIANPAGISCNGCGFINASRATLTTGTPMLNGGDLIGYRVTGGVINILGAGLDTSQTNYTDIIARAVNVNAGVWAQNLNVTTGANQVLVDTSGNTNSTAAITGTGSIPTFAIDVAALGGMYAGKIHLIGTEAGLGVRNAGTIGASAGEVTIDVNGQLTNRNYIGGATQATINAGDISNTGGRITAGQLLNVNAASLSGDGDLLSGGDTAIYLTTDYTQVASGKTQANGNLSLSTTGDIANQGNLLAGNTLSLNAANIDNTATAELTGLNTYINAANTLTNRGLIDGSDTFITAATLNNIGTGSIFGDHVAIAANTLNNTDETVNSTNTAAVIAARNRLDIGANTLTNKNNALIFSAGDMAIGGALDSNHRATGAAGTINNVSASVEALGNLDMTAASLINKKRVFSMERQVTGTNTSNYQECVDPPDCDYIFHNTSTDTVYQDFVTTNSPSATILAGGNANLIISDTRNEYSTIAAGNNLNFVGNSLLNQGAELYQQTDTLLTKVLIHWGDRYHGTWTYPTSNSVLTSTAPAVISAGESLTGSFTGRIDNVTIRQHSPIAPLSNPDITQSTVSALPQSSLFQIAPSAAAGYLIETNPRFASYRSWLSSDYMLSALALDPALTQKRLGDGFYEQRLIREQVSQLTGRRFLVGYASDEVQYQALMNNGVTLAQQLNLTPGIALTAAQVAQLTSDIVWLVKQQVTLPDSTSAEALVPQVYVRLQAGDLNSSGALLTGNNINLKLDGDINNNSTIAGRHVVNLSADNINNIGGRMQAGNQLSLDARHDINVIGTTNDVSMQQNTGYGTSTAQQTQVNRVAGLYVTNPNGILVASAGNDINLKAADVINSGSNGTTLIDAGNNLNLGTLTETTDTFGLGASGGRKGYRRENITQEVGTVIQTDGDLTLNAGNSLTARAANVTSASGTLTATATNDINIEAGIATYDMEAYRKRKSSGTLSSKSSVHRDTVNSTDVISSTFSGNNVNIAAGILRQAQDNRGNITITGSNIVGTSDVNLDAGNNVTLTTEQATHDETHYSKTKKSGFTASSTSIGYGSSKLTNTNDSQQVSNVGSTIGSVEGDVNIISGKTYNQTGSDVLTPQGDINIAAQQVNITHATDTYANQQSMKYKQSGLTLSVSSSALNLAQNVAGTAQAAVTSDSTRNKALNALQTYANASTLQEQGKAIVNAVKAGNVQDAASAAGVKLSVSIGTSSAKSNSSTNVSTQQDSLIKAGGDVTIKATQDDITVKGSQIEADKNIKLEAAKNINLIASADTESNQSKNKSSSTSIGVSVGVGAGGAGFSVDLAASRGKGSANSDSTTYNNTHVTVGETLTLDSGNDTNLIGANAEGKQVIANIGGNLNIQSLQDVATSQAKQSNTGISISVPVASPTLGNTFGAVSQSKQNSNSNYNSVYEQSGIKAGEEGFDIKVNNNTDLKGAAIESIAAPEKNQLTTGTLTTSNIQNHMEAEASSKGTSLDSNMFNSKYAAIKGIAGNLQNHGEENISDNSTTLSAISPATITITDEAKQQQITSNTTETTVALLNRDTTDTNRVLAKPDLQALQEKVQQEQADRMLLVKTATAFTDEAFRKAFLEQAKIYKVQRNADGTVALDDNGKPLKVELKPEEKQNLQSGKDGKVNVYTNGIYNDADLASAYAAQMGQPNAGEVYLVYFPEANNALSELLIASYQKFMENGALGLTNATQEIVNISQNYGANALNLAGHSRGGMTIGNALEYMQQQGNQGLLSGTNIQLYGSAYNAQNAANLLDDLNGDSTKSNLTVQTHQYDFVGRILGANPGTGGTIPEGSSVAGEVLNTFTGEETVHNCYGSGKNDCKPLWGGDFPESKLVKPIGVSQ